MKKWTLLFVVASFIFLGACKKCQTCECYKNGITHVESECAKSLDHDEYFRKWKYEVEEEYGYDYCQCSYD